MLLKLDVLASSTIKRKKPWPRMAWLGKDNGELFLFDSHRISQLSLPSGKTKKRIPLLQTYLNDLQGFAISSNGLFLAAALNSGRILIWNKGCATVSLTAVLDKIRNVQTSTKHISHLQIYISDCGGKVLLLTGLHQVFLWKTQGSDCSLNGVVGDTLKGTWLQIQCGNYVLPEEKDKEAAANGIFFVDPVCGISFSLSWVFNKSDRIHITTLHILWPEKNYTLPVDVSSIQEHGESVESSFIPTWSTYKHSLYNLTPAERVIKSRKAYVARVSPDGQVLVIAMNQKLAAHNRVMFYSLSQSAMALITDLKGCGAKLSGTGNTPMGRCWWIADMAWTRDSLLVVCITRRGSVAVLSKLGEPLEICTEGSSVHTGPALFLPLHPKITFQKSRDSFQVDSSEASVSERDPLSQRFSVSVHPHLPIILSSDGYLVTVMQLPSVASYQGVMTGFMRDVTRLVPGVDVVIQSGNLSRVSSVSRINILQSEANFSRVFTSSEFVSDAPSDNNSTGSSSVVPGYGLATLDQGMSFFGLNDPELESSQPEYNPGSLDAISHAQSLSIMALGLGSACGVNWKRGTGPAMDLIVKVITNLFQYLLWSSGNTAQLLSHTKALSSSTGDLAKLQGSSPLADSPQLSRALRYFRMVLEVFQWDSYYRNVFSWAFHLTHGIVKEILLVRDASVVYRITSCMRVLKLAERLLGLVYSSSGTVTDVVSSDGSQFKQEMEQEAGLGKQELITSNQDVIFDKQESGQDKEKSERIEKEITQGDQESNLIQEVVRERKVVESIPPSVNSKSHSQSLTQTHLSGTWLMLYNFASQNYRQFQKKMASLSTAQEVDSKVRNVEKKMIELLCEIQEKLQVLGQRIPYNCCTDRENVDDVRSYFDGKYHSLPSEIPQNSLFSRRRSGLRGTALHGSNPEIRSTYGSLHRDSTENQQDTPFRFSPAGFPRGREKEQDSKTLLSILYLHLQQYDLRAAFDLIFSLIVPQLSCDELENIGHFSFFPNTQVENHCSNVNHRMDVLLQNYPIARVADKRGLEVVQTFARFMSAYFSNLSLYVYPPYQPIPLPAFCDHGRPSTTSTVTEPLEHSPVIERVSLDRAKVGQAVRDQFINELWSANATLELLLVCGLVSEAAWLAKNLGDWKNTSLLSFAAGVLSSQNTEDLSFQVAFPVNVKSLTPDATFWSRLSPVFNLTTVSGEGKTNSFSFDKFFHSAPSRKRAQQISEISGTEDDKVANDLSGVLEAAVVSNLDFVPIIFKRLLVHLKKKASMLVWIVPEEFYLPYPPVYCPQPASSKKDATSPDMDKEEKLRFEIAEIVQRILLLLNASRCLAPCAKWYTKQLICVTKAWHKVDRSDPEFPVPASLVGYSKQGQSFQETLVNTTPKKKGKKNSARGQGEMKLPQSITSVLGYFREFCAMMWLLHVRDKMSKSSRKYKQLRTQFSGSEEEAATIQSICWETLLWTSRLVPFSSLLDAEDRVNDTLLTLLSESLPTVATAKLTAQYFNDPEVIQTTSGKAKFKRLMASFRGACVSDDTGQEEPLSVIYCKKCVDWAEEVSKQEELFGKVCDQFVFICDEDDDVPLDDHTKAVGTSLFEMQPSYFEFLDTFFMVTVSKILLSQQNKPSSSVPILSSHKEHLISSDTKSIAVLRRKGQKETPVQLTSRASSLFRSQSFTDVRSKADIIPPSLGTSGEIKRSSSMNDVSKLDSLPGIQSLGSFILDLLPTLTWLSRWALQGSSLPSSNFGSRGSEETLPVMRVHVPFPLLVNGLWLLQNVYRPWVSNAEVTVDIKVIRQVTRQRLPDVAKGPSAPVLQVATTTPKDRRLRKVLSDSNIRKSEDKSIIRDRISRQRMKEGDDNRSAPDLLENIQDVMSLSNNATASKINPSKQEPIELTRLIRKDLRSIQHIDRIPKSNSEPNIPNIVVHSPTTDEEKDFSGALKKRHSLRGNGRDSLTYHSEPELAMAMTPVLTSTPTKANHSRKTKRKEQKMAADSGEEKTRITSGSEGTANESSTEPPERFTDAPQRAANIHSGLRTRMAPSRQGKRRKKPVIESNTETEDSVDMVITREASKKTSEVETAGWSQSSVTEAPIVSQAQMELLLVVRSGDSHEQSLQSSVPLIRIPTLLDNSQSSDVTSQKMKTTKAETASQTDRQTLASSASQTLQHSGISSESHLMHQPNQQGLTSSVSQTLMYSGNVPEQNHVINPQVQQRKASHAFEALKNFGAPSGQSHVTTAPTHSVYSQTVASEETKPTKTFLPFLIHQQQSAEHLFNDVNKSQQQTVDHQNQQLTNAARSLPLLHIPVADPATNLDLNKMKLLEIPKRSSAGSTLLHFPKAETSSSQPSIPDLSKIKFLEIQSKAAIRPHDTQTEGSGRASVSSKNWPLLRMGGSHDRSNGVDLRQVKLNAYPPVVREAWPLLETPKREVSPKLIPLEKILAFEKGIRDKLSPFAEPVSLYPQEKENIQPAAENGSRERKPPSDPNPDPPTEHQSKINAPSRQRRRQALEKQTSAQSASQLYKRQRAMSRNRSSHRKVIKVQPAKKAGKVDKILPVNEPVTKKMKPSPKTGIKNSVTLSESELELSDIIDHVARISDEEEYYQPSPEPLTIQGGDHRVPRRDVEAREQLRTSDNREREATSKLFDDILPGPPSMEHIKERIGRKLRDVDEQMAGNRYGSNVLHNERLVNESRTAVEQRTALRQQKTVGVQVNEVGTEPLGTKSAQVSLPNFSDRQERGDTFKVCSSSQTDQLKSRSPPMKRERILVSSGVQTERTSPDFDQVVSHAPALPPDIFLNLQMPPPEVDRDLPPESGFVHGASTAVPGRQIEADVVVATHSHIDDVDRGSDSFPLDIHKRQFLSVADMDSEQWLKVQNTPMAAPEERTSTEEAGWDGKQRERSRGLYRSGGVTSSEGGSKSPEMESDEETRTSKKNVKGQSFGGADRVTMEMISTTDVPVERIHSVPFTTNSRSSARAAATHSLNERMKEMSERIETMDHISQNMDREFKSSRVLLSAIQSIDEVLYPSSNEFDVSKGSERSHSRIPRQWTSTAPWRKGPKGRQGPGKPTKAEDVEDSTDVDEHSTEKEVAVDGAAHKDDKNIELRNGENIEDLNAEDDAESNEEDRESSMQQQQLEEERQRSGNLSNGDEKETDKEEEELKIEYDSLERITPTEMVDKHRSSTEDNADKDGKAFDPLESLSLPRGKLREILKPQKDTKRTRDTSPEGRDELKEWMNKKRAERQAKWRSEQDERRTQEYQPFTPPTQGSRSYKEMKLMEKERKLKRRKTDDQHNKKRIESASNLLCEMLAEPVPKQRNPWPNLRYGTTVNSRNFKPVTEKKKKLEGLKKQPKGPKKAKQDPAQRGVLKDESVAATSNESSIPDGTYRAGSLFSEDIPKTSRMKTTPRFDNIDRSSPVSVDNHGSDVSGREDLNFVNLGKKEKIAEDDYWRSKSPTGSEFVTTQTYQNFAKTRTKRLKARQASWRKTALLVPSSYRSSPQPRGVEAMELSHWRTQPTDSPIPGSRTLMEIDRLLEDDDDEFTLDEEKLEGIESLIEGDDELRDLLSDVDWRSIRKKVDSKTPTSRHQRLWDNREKDESQFKVGGDRISRFSEPAVRSSSGLSRGLNVELSPWSIAQSLQTSDDVAQLLADVDEAVGNMSQSTGTPRSNIDWDEVDKIMEET